jgi:hypothetical protein
MAGNARQALERVSSSQSNIPVMHSAQGALELEVELLVVENFRAIFAPQSEPIFCADSRRYAQRVNLTKQAIDNCRAIGPKAGGLR